MTLAYFLSPIKFLYLSKFKENENLWKTAKKMNIFEKPQRKWKFVKNSKENENLWKTAKKMKICEKP